MCLHSFKATGTGRISAQIRLLVIRGASQAHQEELAIAETSSRYSGTQPLNARLRSESLAGRSWTDIDCEQVRQVEAHLEGGVTPLKSATPAK